MHTNTLFNVSNQLIGDDNDLFVSSIGKSLPISAMPLSANILIQITLAGNNHGFANASNHA